MKNVALVFSVAALFITLLVLGFWQLDRAQQKTKLLAAKQVKSGRLINSLQELPALTADEFPRVRLTGQFLNHFSLLQDNRTHQQRIGYVVLTLFEDAASGALIWVNRGWTLGHSDRNQLPQITPVQGTVSIQGRLRVVENNRWLKALSNNQNEWPFVVLTQNNPSINRMLEQRLATHIAVPTLVLEEGSDYGFTQSWRQQVTISPDKHIAYAVQWFMLAATLLVMVSIFYYKQRKNDVKQS